MSDAIPTTTFRLFVAISIPESVKSEMEKTQAELRRALPGDFIRWTKREQLHLTLKFLGDVEAQRVESLAGSLREACQSFSPLQLRAASAGCFPDVRRPRVVWAGVTDEKDSLPRLQAAVESMAKDFSDEAAEGKFTGHVTLARCRMIQRPQAGILAGLVRGLADKMFGAWTADAVELIRSEPLPVGSRYVVLASAPLSK